MSFTPSPWIATNRFPLREPLDSGFQISSEDGKTIAVTHLDSWSTREEEKANARLLAAAPDLLIALEKIMVFARFGAHEMGTDTTEHPDFVAARSAITRAIRS